MLTSSRYQISYPNPSRVDTPDVPRDIGALVTAIEKSVMYGTGLIADRPVSTAGTPGIVGRVYVSTDESPRQLYWDYGTGWFNVGGLAAGSVGTLQLADGSVTTVKLPDNVVTSLKLADSAVTTAKLADGAITGTKVAAALKPSGGAGAGTEALRALGTGAGNAAAGNDSRFRDRGIVTSDAALSGGINGEHAIIDDAYGSIELIYKSGYWSSERFVLASSPRVFDNVTPTTQGEWYVPSYPGPAPVEVNAGFASVPNLHVNVPAINVYLQLMAVGSVYASSGGTNSFFAVDAYSIAHGGFGVGTFLRRCLSIYNNTDTGWLNQQTSWESVPVATTGIINILFVLHSQYGGAVGFRGSIYGRWQVGVA